MIQNCSQDLQNKHPSHFRHHTIAQAIIISSSLVLLNISRRHWKSIPKYQNLKQHPNWYKTTFIFTLLTDLKLVYLARTLVLHLKEKHDPRFWGKPSCCYKEKNCQDNKTWKVTERWSPAVVVLEYVINFGLGVSDGFNIYTKDQYGRIPFCPSVSKNGPLFWPLWRVICEQFITKLYNAAKAQANNKGCWQW